MTGEEQNPRDKRPLLLVEVIIERMDIFGLAVGPCFIPNKVWLLGAVGVYFVKKVELLVTCVQNFFSEKLPRKWIVQPAVDVRGRANPNPLTVRSREAAGEANPTFQHKSHVLAFERSALPTRLTNENAENARRDATSRPTYRRG